MSLKHVFNTVKNHSPLLYWIVIVHLVLAIVSITNSFMDDRTLMGVNVWMKPLKFSISVAIYILTVGFLMTLYPFSKKKKNLINNIVCWTLLIELGLIIYQASGGVQSHYNISNPFDGLIFTAMGILIAINVIIMALFIFETIRLKLKTPKLLQWAILLGWVIIFFGSWVGGQMISEMSHNIGVEDGGPGLPLVNWSTIAGDLRVAHFFGLHGLQIIPILALLISIPTINLFTHGTHITVAHSMGTTIGINSTILIAAIFYIVSKENKFSLNKYKKRLNIAFWLFHISLLVFWGSLLYSGYLKGIWDQMDMPKTSFSEFITDLKPVIHVLVSGGLFLFISIEFITNPLIKALINKSKK